MGRPTQASASSLRLAACHLAPHLAHLQALLLCPGCWVHEARRKVPDAPMAPFSWQSDGGPALPRALQSWVRPRATLRLEPRATFRSEPRIQKEVRFTLHSEPSDSCFSFICVARDLGPVTHCHLDLGTGDWPRDFLRLSPPCLSCHLFTLLLIQMNRQVKLQLPCYPSGLLTEVANMPL